MFNSARSSTDSWSRRQQITVLIAISIVGFLFRIGWVAWIDPQPWTDFSVYRTLAVQLAEGNGYTNADGTPTGFFLVGYPFLLSLVVRAFGDQLIYLQLINILFSAAAIPASYFLSRSFLSSRVSLGVAVLVAVNPSFLLYSGVLATENPSVLMIIGLWYAGIRIFRGSPKWQIIVIYGLMVAASMYVRPVAMTILVAVSGARSVVSDK